MYFLSRRTGDTELISQSQSIISILQSTADRLDVIQRTFLFDNSTTSNAGETVQIQPRAKLSDEGKRLLSEVSIRSKEATIEVSKIKMNLQKVGQEWEALGKSVSGVEDVPIILHANVGLGEWERERERERKEGPRHYFSG